MTPPPRRFQITLVDTPCDANAPPADVRLRALLKRALRSFGLRCERAQELIDDPPPPEEPHAA